MISNIRRTLPITGRISSALAHSYFLTVNRKHDSDQGQSVENVRSKGSVAVFPILLRHKKFFLAGFVCKLPRRASSRTRHNRSWPLSLPPRFRSPYARLIPCCHYYAGSLTLATSYGIRSTNTLRFTPLI